MTRTSRGGFWSGVAAVALFFACSSEDQGADSSGAAGDRSMSPAGGAVDIAPSPGEGGIQATGGLIEGGAATARGGETAGGAAAAAGALAAGAGAGGGSDEAVPQPNLLFKTLPPAGAYDVNYGGVTLADANARFTQLGADGYLATTAEAFKIFNDTSIRYIAFKPQASATAYDVRYSGVTLADANARFTQLGADGYVVTTAEAFTIFNETSIRYIAFKPQRSAITYDVKYSGVTLADANARFTQLGADGYVVTTAEAFTIFNDTSIRYIAFKPQGSATTYDVKYSGVTLAEANTRFTQLGADGYVVTTAEAFTIFNDTSTRYIAFKPL